MLERVWRKRNTLTLWVGMQIGAAIMRTVWMFFKKLKIELPYEPEITLLAVYLENTIIRKDTCTSMFTGALFTIAQTWN